MDDLLFKVIVVGEPSVGKTSLLYQYQNDQFKQNQKPTLGFEFFQKKVIVSENTPVSLQIWDTAGHNSFKTMVKQFFRQSAAVFLVYSITNQQSLEALQDWLNHIKEIAHPDIVAVLVGNKCDLNDKRQVNYQQAHDFMMRNQIEMMFETSAFNGENVTKAFEETAKRIFIKILQNSGFRSAIKSARNNVQQFTEQRKTGKFEDSKIQEQIVNEIDENRQQIKESQSFLLSVNKLPDKQNSQYKKKCC